LENVKLNNLVVAYQTERNNDDFNEIYRYFNAKWSRTIQSVAKSIRSNEADTQALYEDSLMKAIENYDPERGDFVNVVNNYIRRARTDLYRKTKRQHEREYYEVEKQDEEGGTYETAISMLPADVNVEEEIIAKEKADNRQVISSILSDADERTTAIVQTFLASPKPTPTSVGNEMNLHHSVVIRSIKRLAANFDTNKYGDYRDYLLA
jgi:DNA-directed RNA polymerase specialized sigma24 family protein